jgi:hypothetical protein
MMYMRDKGSTEVSGFALTDEKDEYLVIDFIMPKQECGAATTEMSAEGLVEMFDKLSGPPKFGGMGLSPSRYGRIWIHTHPGFSSEPSGTDWATFRQTFGGKDWAIMFILSNERAATCILQIEDVPGAYFRIPWGVDWDYAFAGTNFEAWDKEYDDKVDARTYTYYGGYGGYRSYNYGASGTSKYGDCSVCKKKNIWLYEYAGKKMCWNCKQNALDKTIGDVETEADTEAGIDYSKWDDLMGDDREGADEFPSTSMPASCEECGESRYILDEIDGRWLCWSCQRKLRDELIAEDSCGFVGEAIDNVFGADTEVMDDDDTGGFVDEKAQIKDDEYDCDRCNTATKVVFLIESDDPEYDDEYVCLNCWKDELEDRKRAVDDEDEVFETGGFTDDEEEEETTTSDVQEPTVPVDPLDRYYDDPGRPPFI